MEIKSSYLDQYKIIKTLGSGYHAKVKLAEATDGTLVAIKKFKEETANLKTLQHQLSIMKKLHHQNLVNLIDVRQNALYKKKTGEQYKCFVIILEYVSGGQLFDFVAIGGRFSQTVTRTYFYQLLNAVNYMHEKGFAHRDIKPQNILLTSNYVLKLADFGFATLLEGKDKSHILHTKLGTQGYMAPQIQTKNYDGKKADIFSCGVILFVMFTASPPFQKAVHNDPYYKMIKDKNYKSFWISHSRKRNFGFFSDSFKDLIQKMLAYNPSQRPTLQQISQHSWIKGQIVSIASLKQQFNIRKSKVDAETQKQKQDKQQKKKQAQNALFKQQNVYPGQNTYINQFIEQYQRQSETSRKLQVKQKIHTTDLVIQQRQDFIFTMLRLHLKKKTTVANDLQLQFVPTFTMQNHKINIKYDYWYEQSKESIQIQLTVCKTKQGKIVLSFKNLGGNFLYYKMLVRDIQLMFSYCNLNQ